MLQLNKQFNSNLTEVISIIIMVCSAAIIVVIVVVYLVTIHLVTIQWTIIHKPCWMKTTCKIKHTRVFLDLFSNATWNLWSICCWPTTFHKAWLWWMESVPSSSLLWTKYWRECTLTNNWSRATRMDKTSGTLLQCSPPLVRRWNY